MSKREEILEKIKKASTIKDTAILSESKIFKDKEMVVTPVYALNIAFSGSLFGGFYPGCTTWAGPSKHFKTLFSLYMAKCYMDQYKDAVMILYDSEFGAPYAYFESLSIDPERVVHKPILDIEELKFDLMQQITAIEKGDKVIIVVDSIGNLASVKEVEDTTKQKSVQDMSRAKALKSFFRVISPRCTMKDIPLIIVNHTYSEIGPMYPKQIVSGGTGNYYNSDAIFILGRQQEVDGVGLDRELTGYSYVINIEKSRYVKEKSKILIDVSFDEGISKYAGLLPLAMEFGYISGSKGWYTKPGEDKKYRAAQMDEEFWKPIIADPQFEEMVRKKYQLSEGALVSE